jgi:hypothetical protein
MILPILKAAGVHIDSITGKGYVEQGSLLPLSRRELARGMVGKKRLTLIRGDCWQTVASKLARKQREQAPALHMPTRAISRLA